MGGGAGGGGREFGVSSGGPQTYGKPIFSNEFSNFAQRLVAPRIPKQPVYRHCAGRFWIMEGLGTAILSGTRANATIARHFPGDEDRGASPTMKKLPILITAYGGVGGEVASDGPPFVIPHSKAGPWM
jgi:hypothetical protein